VPDTGDVAHAAYDHLAGTTAFARSAFAWVCPVCRSNGHRPRPASRASGRLRGGTHRRLPPAEGGGRGVAHRMG
jgi:hypothetical protein